MAASKQEFDTTRINFLDLQEYRSNSTAKDQQYINGYFNPVYNKVKQAVDYFWTKRPGTATYTRPPAANAAGRGMYAWSGTGLMQIYSVFGRKIYAGTTDLGVTMPVTDATSFCDFTETRPGAATQYLGINTGQALYLIDSSDDVTILNNVAITSSSVANPTVITTSTTHGLTTGNKVYIVGHAGSTPSINSTVYVATVTSTTTFTIPVNVTVGGTGGTLGIFPATNTGDLVYMDGYWFVAKSTGTIYNCDVDNPLIWDPTKVITAQMFAGNLVGLAKQNNYLMAFGETWMQSFFNNANASGSPLNNVESNANQIGCIAQSSIAHDENSVMWVSNSKLGGFTVWKLDGTTGLKDVGTPEINRFLMGESLLSTSKGFYFRLSGKLFYFLYLQSSAVTFVYDVELDLWMNWTTTGTTLPFSMISVVQTTGFSNQMFVQNISDGRILELSTTTYQDLVAGVATDFTFQVRTKRHDNDTIKRKFCHSLDVVGDQQTTTDSTTDVSIQYSDDDYVTTSTARTVNMGSTRPFLKALGNFRRRSWTVSHTGNAPMRLTGLEIVTSEGDY